VIVLQAFQAQEQAAKQSPYVVSDGLEGWYVLLAVSRAVRLVAAAGFVLAGVGVIADQAWWALTGLGAGAVALLLMTLFFNPWLLAGIAISVGILYAGFQALPQA